jgi:hypothetical protein
MSESRRVASEPDHLVKELTKSFTAEDSPDSNLDAAKKLAELVNKDANDWDDKLVNLFTHPHWEKAFLKYFGTLMSMDSCDRIFRSNQHKPATMVKHLQGELDKWEKMLRDATLYVRYQYYQHRLLNGYASSPIGEIDEFKKPILFLDYHEGRVEEVRGLMNHYLAMPDDEIYAGVGDRTKNRKNQSDLSCCGFFSCCLSSASNSAQKEELREDLLKTQDRSDLPPSRHAMKR